MTIKDIAKEAGVSIATVSRIINNSEHSVRPSTREKVMRVIKKHDFHINSMASGLKSSKTFVVAYIMPNITTFFMEIAKGLGNILSMYNYSLIFADTDFDKNKELDILRKLISRKVDGIVLSTMFKNSESVEICKKHNIPIVLADRGIESADVNSVLWNDYEGARELTEYIIAMGHKKIAIERTLSSVSTGTDRYNGYLSALKSANIELVQDFISQENSHMMDSYHHVFTMLTKSDRPTCILCTNNIMVQGALKAINQLKLHIPEDISLVSIGNLSTNSYGLTSITCAKQDSIKLGELAGKNILDLMCGKDDVPSRVVKMELDIKDSVKKI